MAEAVPGLEDGALEMRALGAVRAPLQPLLVLLDALLLLAGLKPVFEIIFPRHLIDPLSAFLADRCGPASPGSLQNHRS